MYFVMERRMARFLPFLMLFAAFSTPMFLPIASPFAVKLQTTLLDRITPGLLETSEFLIGSIAVSVVLLESSGRIDHETESWTVDQEAETISKVQYALEWWANQNPSANVSFTLDIHYRIPTSYEPINRPYADRYLWVNEAMRNLGYEASFFETKEREYVNDLRNNLQTDWAFMIFLVPAFNDIDGKFSDGKSASALRGGPSLTVPVSMHGSLEWVLAHEVAHVFWATDEYNGIEEISGYLDVPDVENSGCLMERWDSWNLSGRPHGLNGTWGQIGWRDSDGDGIQDIVDTVPSVTLIYHSLNPVNNTLRCNGSAYENPYPNRNPNSIYRNDITTNKIQSVQFKLDDETWKDITIIPTFDAYLAKNTTAMVDFTFIIPSLRVGNHTIELRAANNWGNAGTTKGTITIPEPVQKVALIEMNPYRTIVSNNTITSTNVTAENRGITNRGFNVTLYCNHTLIENKPVTLEGGESTTLVFNWNTSAIPLGNYVLKAVASEVIEQGRLAQTNLTYEVIRISIQGDVNTDFVVNIVDVSTAARVFGTRPRDKRWDSNMDVNEDGEINIVDLSTIAMEFGHTVESSFR